MDSRYSTLEHQNACHDTFDDFNVLGHEQFTKCYTRWIYSIVNELSGQVVAIDGKALLPTKGEKDKCQCHLVTVYFADITCLSAM